MARCAYCGTSILFGGTRAGELRFCNAECHRRAYYQAIADQVPEDLMRQQIELVHEGPCPKCGGPGPVDVHMSYTVWSALVVTSWRSKPEICCRSCGVKSKLAGAASSAVLGWWGFPWGLVATPIQVVRNVGGLFVSPDPTRPSPQLESMVRTLLAARIVEAQRQEQEQQQQAEA